MKPADTESNASACLCPDCPTYNDCMRDNAELLFCGRGGTSCEVSAVECICGDCSVWAENSLSSYYFCIRGAAE